MMKIELHLHGAPGSPLPRHEYSFAVTDRRTGVTRGFDWVPDDDDGLMELTVTTDKRGVPEVFISTPSYEVVHYTYEKSD